MVLHQMGCWETAAWDVEPSRFITQLWRLDTHSEMWQQEQASHPEVMQQLPDCRWSHWYAFHAVVTGGGVNAEE
jgi:hypothetical protein